MDRRPEDIDTARALVAARGLTVDAAAFITHEVAMHLPFEYLGRFKTLLKRFFSAEPWDESHEAELSDIALRAVSAGWWEHTLDGGIRMAHGVTGDRYVLWVSGGTGSIASLFDRVFSGPVVPEPTPHPRKVKFAFGGEPGPGVWHRRTDGDPDDARIARLLAEPDVTDVMLAGDFVTIGLDRTSSWERRLDPLLGLVTELFAGGEPVEAPERTRHELMTEGRRVRLDVRPAELHLLDPDDPAERSTLLAALNAHDPKVRRVAVAVLAESSDDVVRRQAVRVGFADEARIVRRAAIDAAADAEDELLRPLFEHALRSEDAWVRWKGVRSIGELGVGSSRGAVAALADDPDFQVRFEVARALQT